MLILFLRSDDDKVKNNTSKTRKRRRKNKEDPEKDILALRAFPDSIQEVK